MRPVINRIPVVAMLILFAPAMARAASPPEQVSGNAIWSWWTSPIAVAGGGSNSDLYFTGVNSGGIQRVLHHDGSTLLYTNLSSAHGVDDHNAPALSMVTGHPTLAFYAGHPGRMRYRIAAPGSIAFGAERTVPWVFDIDDDTSTYAQVLRDGHRVIVLTRANDNKWWYLTSPDSGQTWGPPRVFFDGKPIGKSYTLLRPFDGDPLSFHVAAYRNPEGTTENLIGYKTITFDSVWDGVGVGFEHSDLDIIWTPPVGRGYRFRLLDIGDKNGKALVYYARWNDDTRTPQYYTAVRGTSGWTSTKIISAGDVLYDAENKYVGGIALDRRQGVARFYLCHFDEPTGEWNLVTYRIDDAGAPYLRVLLDMDIVPLARPVSVGEGVIYQRLLHYGGYKDFQSHVWYIRDVSR